MSAPMNMSTDILDDEILALTLLKIDASCSRELGPFGKILFVKLFNYSIAKLGINVKTNKYILQID